MSERACCWKEKAGRSRPAVPIMNWYLLNIPLAIAIATAVVAPIMVVISREELGDSTHEPAALADTLADTVFAPAPEHVLALV